MKATEEKTHALLHLLLMVKRSLVTTTLQLQITQIAISTLELLLTTSEVDLSPIVDLLWTYRGSII